MHWVRTYWNNATGNVKGTNKIHSHLPCRSKFWI